MILTTSARRGAMAVSLAVSIAQSAAEASWPSPDDFTVHGLQDVVPQYADFDGTMNAGMMPIFDEAESESDAAGADSSSSEKSLFFWLFLPNTPTTTMAGDNQDNNDTLLIWLNGGPGCSSMVGSLFENGPVVTSPFPAGTPHTEERPPLVRNPYSWTKATAMLYVEQPVGIGFSKGPDDYEPQNEEDLSRDFHGFLRSFFGTFEDLTRRKLFIFGESYAGYYVPSIARYVHLRNEELRAKAAAATAAASSAPSLESGIVINLAGIGLGNGWIDPVVQGKAMIDYAYWHGMIDASTKEALHAKFEWSASRWSGLGDGEGGKGGKEENGEGDYSPPFHPFTTPDECGTMEAVVAAAGAWANSNFRDGDLGAPNVYDVTTWDTYPTLFSLNGTVTTFFNEDRIREALNAPQEATVGNMWLECIPGSGRRRLQRHNARSRLEDFASWQRRSLHLLDQDRPASVVPYIAELLDAGVRVLVYNGDRDLSCCAQGSEEALAGMEWNGREGWADPVVARRGLWIVKEPPCNDKRDGKDDYDGGESDAGGGGGHTEVGGYAKSYQNLAFVVVYNSGHLVPTNRPRAALDLLSRFLKEESFADAELPLFLSGREDDKKPIPSTQDQSDRSQENHFYAVLISVVCGITIGGLTSVILSNKCRRKVTTYEQIPSTPVPGTPGANGIAMQ